MRESENPVAAKISRPLRSPSHVQLSFEDLKDIQAEFVEEFGQRPWMPFEVIDIQKTHAGTLIFVRGWPPFSRGALTLSVVEPEALPKKDDWIFLHNSTVSFFDSEHLSVIEYAVIVTHTKPAVGTRKKGKRRKRHRMSRMIKR